MIPLDHHFNELLNETIPFPLPKAEEVTAKKVVPTKAGAETVEYSCSTFDCLCETVATPEDCSSKPQTSPSEPTSKIEIAAKPTVPFEIDQDMVVNRPRLMLKDSGLPVTVHPTEHDPTIIGESVFGFKWEPKVQAAPEAQGIQSEVSSEILDLLENQSRPADRPFPKVFHAEETVAEALEKTMENLLYDSACEMEEDLDEAYFAEAESTATEALPEEPPKQDEATFFPMLQVDRYAWPRFCTEMHPVIKTQLANLGEQLIAKSAASGKKVVAVAGSGPGAGSTSILLGLASTLEAAGQKVAVIDANINSPTLAESLGLQPEQGWETVLSGKLPVEESLIDSIEDRIALLPLCLEASQKITFGVRPAENDRMNAAMQQMREHYDLLLVDLGSPEAADVAAFANMSEWIDSAVVVHNLRDASRAQLVRIKNMMRDYGVSVAGVAENFAPCETCFEDDSYRAA